MDAFMFAKRLPAVLLATAALLGCGSKGGAPRDASAGDADGPHTDAPHDVAPHDVAPNDVAIPTDTGADVTNGPAPVVLARAPGCGAARLALADGTLFWTERATGLVKKVSVTGGAPTVVAAGQAMPGAIAADDVAVYWSDEGDRTLRRATLDGADDGDGDGGVPAPLLTAAAPVSALVAAGGVLYYSAGTSTFAVPRAGGVPSTLATFATCRPNTPGAIAAGGAYVYETADLLQFIVRARTDGAQLGNNPCVAADAGAPQINIPETVSHTQGALLLDALAVTGSEVVWADHGFIAAKTTGVVAQATSRDVALSAGSNVITGFVVSGARVYLGESDDPGAGPTAHTIQVAPFGAAGDDAETPTATVVATGQWARARSWPTPRTSTGSRTPRPRPAARPPTARSRA
jgi:hypothetical protein